MKTIKVSDEVYDYLKGMIDDPNDNRDSDLANSIRIIQAMIDSSGTVEPTGGFDLEKARDAAKFDDHMAITMFPLAMAEIERLRADYDKLKSSLLVIDGCKKLMNQAARIDELEADNQNLVTLNKSLMNNDWILRDNNRKYRKRAQKAELLNKELKADLEQSERVVEARLDVIDQQAARIKELEDALVEERVQVIAYQIPHAKENVNWAPVFKLSRQQLRAEGKIGPDAKPREGLFGKYIIRKSDGHPVDPEADYFVMRLDTDPVARRAAREYSYVTPDRNLARGLQDRLARYDPQLKDCMNIQFFGLAKPHCWQITEEREAAIMETIDLLNGDLFRSPYSDVLAVLRGMLTKADHDKP